jgi:hypothetical protein
MPKDVPGILIAGAVLVLVLALRMSRMRRVQELSPERLWVVPALFAIVVATTLGEYPPRGAAEWAALAVAMAVGAALGWQRGRLMKIWRDPATGRLMSQGSGWAILFLVALIVLRAGLRAGLAYEAKAWAIDMGIVNGAFAVFALGLFGVQRLEMYIRARRLAVVAR